MRAVYTIGFTQKSAAKFFTLLRKARVERLLDVRLNNVSQLSGFAKKDDLAYFLEAICKAEYIHEPLLAPTKQMLDSYKKDKGSWESYEVQFLDLMQNRRVEERLDRTIFDVPTVLLCSEAAPGHCHRRLVLEYLQDKWRDFEIAHL